MIIGLFAEIIKLNENKKSDFKRVKKLNLPAFWNEIGKQISGRTAYKKIKIHFQSIQKLNYQKYKID